jgi:hypothetical protein
MKLTSIQPLVNQASKLQDDLSLIIHQQDWLKTISLGQIIKGKVLKVYDTNRYGVMIAGQERVVDSTISFQVGQQLSAKVMDIHDNKVSLKLIERSANREIVSTNITESKPQGLVDSLIRQFNMERLSDAQKQTINDIGRTFGNDTFAIKMALYLAKVGLPISETLIKNLLKSADLSTFVVPHQSNPGEVSQVVNTDNQPAFYLAMAEILSGKEVSKGFQQDFEEAANKAGFEQSMPGGYIAATDLEKNASGFDTDSEQTPFMTLLNIDTDGAIAHSFDVLAIIINDRLMEFDVAFFDQVKAEAGVTLSKQIVFELETLAGKVGIVAKLVNNRLSVAFDADQSTLLDALQQQQNALSHSLNNAGWVLEQMHYAKSMERTSAIGAVIDHVLTQGSMEVVL